MREVGVAHRVTGLIEDLPAFEVHEFQMRLEVGQILWLQSGQETISPVIFA
jgi:hypothetical protein